MAELDFATDGHVATITFNRPEKLNAMTPEMAEALLDAVARCNREDDIRAVIVTGTGRAFCAGSDIKALDSYATPWAFRNRGEYCDALRSIRKPTIAAVNGHAFGGGLEMALACDIRIAVPGAKLGAPEIKLGWIGGGGMAAMLAQSAGMSNAALMLMTGEPITTDTALGWGLVSELHEGEALAARARQIADQIAANAPIAAETAKTNLQAVHSMPFDKAVAYERDLQTICFATEDAAEGRAAFAEKRPPVFRKR